MSTNTAESKVEYFCPTCTVRVLPCEEHEQCQEDGLGHHDGGCPPTCNDPVYLSCCLAKKKDAVTPEVVPEAIRESVRRAAELFGLVCAKAGAKSPAETIAKDAVRLAEAHFAAGMALTKLRERLYRELPGDTESNGKVQQPEAMPGDEQNDDAPKVEDLPSLPEGYRTTIRALPLPAGGRVLRVPVSGIDLRIGTAKEIVGQLCVFVTELVGEGVADIETVIVASDGAVWEERNGANYLGSVPLGGIWYHVYHD